VNGTNNAARRAALARDMHGATAHPTSPLRLYDGDFDGDGDASALNRAAADDWDDADEMDMDYDDARPQRVTRPKPRAAAQGSSMSQRAARRNGSSAARLQPRTREMIVELPVSKTELPDDTVERKRVMRYLDKKPRATVDEIMKYARVSNQTARRHRDAWRERLRRAGVDVAPTTEEMAIITPEMLTTDGVADGVADAEYQQVQ
jgi:hypothetical protein